MITYYIQKTSQNDPPVERSRSTFATQYYSNKQIFFMRKKVVKCRDPTKEKFIIKQKYNNEALHFVIQPKNKNEIADAVRQKINLIMRNQIKQAVSQQSKNAQMSQNSLEMKDPKTRMAIIATNLILASEIEKLLKATGIKVRRKEKVGHILLKNPSFRYKVYVNDTTDRNVNYEASALIFLVNCKNNRHLENRDGASKLSWILRVDDVWTGQDAVSINQLPIPYQEALNEINEIAKTYREGYAKEKQASFFTIDDVIEYYGEKEISHEKQLYLNGLNTPIILASFLNCYETPLLWSGLTNSPITKTILE